MRSLQLLLRDHWDFVDESVVFAWTPEIELGFRWRSDAHHLLASVSLVSPQPALPLPGLAVGPSRPICLGSVVGRGAELLHPPARAPDLSPRLSPLRLSSDGSLDRGAYHQHHSPVVHPQPEKYVLTYTTS